MTRTSPQFIPGKRKKARAETRAFNYPRVLAPVDFALQTASNDEELDALRLEAFFQHVDCAVNEDVSAAVEQVYGCVTMLGPGVNRVMRFLDDDGAADAVGLEFVEALFDNGGFASYGGFAHGGTDDTFDFKGFRATAVKLYQEMGTERRLLTKSHGETFFVSSKPLGKFFFVVAMNQGPSRFIHKGRGH